MFIRENRWDQGLAAIVLFSSSIPKIFEIKFPIYLILSKSFENREPKEVFGAICDNSSTPVGHHDRH